MLVDWEQEMPHLVALLRGTMAEHIGEPMWESFVAELCAVSEDFRSLWRDRRVAHPEPRVKRFRHPEVGMLHLMGRSYWMAPRAGMRLVTYAPVEAESEQGLSALAASDRPPFSEWSELARSGRCALAAPGSPQLAPASDSVRAP